MNEQTLFKQTYTPIETVPQRLQARLNGTLDKIRKATEAALKGAESTLVEECSAQPIDLHVTAGEVTWSEPSSGSTSADGITAGLKIPFDGSKFLLSCLPSQEPTEMPKGFVGDTVAGSGYVRFHYSSRTISADDFNAWRADNETRLQEWVRVVNDDVRTYLGTVQPAIREAIATRRAVLKELAAFDSGIRR